MPDNEDIPLTAPEKPVRPQPGRVPGFGKRPPHNPDTCPACGATPPCDPPPKR